MSHEYAWHRRQKEKKKRRGRNIKCRSYRCVLIGIINIIVAWKRKLKFSLLWENFPLVVFSSIKLIDVFVPFVVLDVVAIITIPPERFQQLASTIVCDCVCRWLLLDSTNSSDVSTEVESQWNVIEHRMNVTISSRFATGVFDTSPVFRCFVAVPMTSAA